MSVLRAILGMALTLPWWTAAIPAAAAEPPPGDVRVGFDGVYRTGSWTPLVVEFADPSTAPPAVCAWVEDPDGQYVRSPPAPVERAGGAPARARLTVRFGRPTGRVLIEEVTPGMVRTADRAAVPVRMLPPPLPAGADIVLVLGDLPAAERASRLLAREDGTRPRMVPIPGAAAGSGAGEAAAALGRTANDFDGADAIIVCGRAVAGFEPAVLRGIDEWVRQGGRLVFLAGETAVDVDRGATAAAAWLPGTVEKLVPLRRGSAIETYARASRPLDKNAFTNLGLPLLRNPRAIDGSVEAFEGRGPADQPFVVRRGHGLGTVVWMGVDVDRPPFRTWSGSDSLLVELLNGRGSAKESQRAADQERGGLDLAGQLRQAIDRFPGVAPIPFEVVAGLGVLYVACLYPLDWWLASRRGRRAGGPPGGWVPWLSLPVLVAVCSGLAWGAGQRWKGVAWRTSAAEVVDIDATSGLVRASGYAGIWSPVNATLDISVAPDRRILPVGAADGGSAVTWFAAGGRGIGGTDAVSPHPSLAMADYGHPASSPGRTAAAAPAEDGLVGVPIAASSSRLFECECIAVVESPAVASSLVKEGQGTLRGAITSRLPFTLEDSVLAHAGWLYEIGRLESGRSFDTGTGRGPRSLAGALTRRTTNRDRDIATRWSLSEPDPLRILEIAGFHAAAGGRGYTGLEPGRLARLDLSPVLPLDRAVLMGRGPGLVAWRCRADGTFAAASAMPPIGGKASLWRIVIPLPRPNTTPSSPPDSPTDDTP